MKSYNISVAADGLVTLQTTNAGQTVSTEIKSAGTLIFDTDTDNGAPVYLYLTVGSRRFTFDLKATFIIAGATIPVSPLPALKTAIAALFPKGNIAPAGGVGILTGDSGAKYVLKVDDSDPNNLRTYPVLTT